MFNSNIEYNRHNYTIVYKNKNKKTFDDYSEMLFEWRKTPDELLDFVEIVDKKQKKPKKGFS